MTKVVFIGGTGRSGTNITCQILGTHPKAARLPFEYRFTIDPDGIVDFYRSYPQTWSPYLADKRLKRLEKLLSEISEVNLLHGLVGGVLKLVDKNGKLLSPKRYAAWELKKHIPGFKTYVKELLDDLREFSYQGVWPGTGSYTFLPCIYYAKTRSQEELREILGRFLEKVFESLLAEANADFYVEDNTWNILFARELLQLVPEAKIVHVYRDPRDVVASMIQQRWCPKDKEHTAMWYKTIIEHWFSIRSDLPPGSYYEMKLEDLVNAPEKVVRELCDFIQIPYSQCMVCVDLSHAHSGRWKKDFSREEQKQVKRIIGDLVTDLGYR